MRLWTGLPVSRDWRTSCGVLRAVARLAQCALVERSFPSVFSFPVESSIFCTACLFMLTDALDDS